MVEASLFIPLIIIAVTQVLKMAFPAIHGFVTVLTAGAVGIVVALVDQLIGIADITVAQGLVYALGAVGITTAASKAGGSGAGAK